MISAQPALWETPAHPFMTIGETATVSILPVVSLRSDRWGMVWLFSD